MSSALGEAVRHHRLDHNPARPTIIPRPAAAERHIWTVDEAVAFLRYCHTADPLMADLVEGARDRVATTSHSCTTR
ncbi:hypothetical protein ACFY2W_27285 [Streptomyces sp. NPDC001262]|uniref:hypothetical protein n=1 Tax=unclassified Streptomyces TaxID=2593676 RepID=UPI00367D71C9